MISVTQHKRIFVTQYKMDPRNTTYTKLAQADTGNTIYTKYHFLLSVFFCNFADIGGKRYAMRKQAKV